MERKQEWEEPRMKVEHRQRVWRSNARMSCSSAAVCWEAVADSAVEDLKGCTNRREFALGHLRKSQTVRGISSVSVCARLFVHWSTVCLTLRSEFLRWYKFLTLNLGFIDFASVFVLLCRSFLKYKGFFALEWPQTPMLSQYWWMGDTFYSS